MKAAGLQFGVLAGLVWLAMAGVSAGQMPPPMPGAGGSEAAAQDVIAGTVLETMDAGRYTYVRIAHAGKDVWAAGPLTAVAVGAEVELATGLPMANFASPSLNRTFELVYFVPEIHLVGQTSSPAVMPDGMPKDAVHQNLAGQLPDGHPDISGLPAGHPDITGLPAGHPVIGNAPAAVAPPMPENLERGTVVQTLEAGRYTYIEVKGSDGNRWIAAPKVSLAAGQEIQYTAGMEMKDFDSPSLGRKFDAIYFVTAVYPVAE